MASWNNPLITDFKTYPVFVRSFPFGTDPNNDVLDTDIAAAFSQTNVNINPALFSTQDAYTTGYLFLAAHYLVIDFQMSSQGLNGQYSWLTQSKAVGSVSQSFAIPQRVLDNPYMAGLSQTSYGSKYLSLILPALCGNVFTVFGDTLP